MRVHDDGRGHEHRRWQRQRFPVLASNSSHGSDSIIQLITPSLTAVVGLVKCDYHGMYGMLGLPL